MRKPKFMLQAFSTSDNTTIDLHRVMGAIVILTGLGLSIYSVIRGDKWDITAFGTGIGLLIAAIGGSTFVNDKNPVTEKKDGE